MVVVNSSENPLRTLRSSLCLGEERKVRKTASNKQTTLFAFEAPLDAKL